MANEEQAVAQKPEVEADGNGYTKSEQQHYHEIRKQERAVAELEDDFNDKNDEAKAAKKRFEAADRAFRAFTHRSPDPQPKLPGMEDLDQPADAWRDVPLTDLALGTRVLTALGAEGLTTMGELVAWQTDGEGREFCMIKGIGPGTANELADRCTTFWAEHSEYTKPMVEVAEVTEAEESSPTPPVDENNGWRSQEVDALRVRKDVTARHIRALRDSKLSTVGEVADLMDQESTWWHRKVKGISKDGAAPVEDAVTALRA